MWRIKKFPGDFEALLRYRILISINYKKKRTDIDLGVTTNTQPWVKPPITVEF